MVGAIVGLPDQHRMVPGEGQPRGRPITLTGLREWDPWGTCGIHGAPAACDAYEQGHKVSTQEDPPKWW